jgi:hypothetical protein
MSFEALERDIRELEAVKYYDVLKKQLEKAVSDNVTVAASANDCASKLEEERGKEETLRKEKESSDSAREAAEQDLKNAREEIAALTEELGNLKNLRSNWDGKTLTEVIAFEQKEREDEIARRSEERLMAIKGGWEKNEKPAEVREEAISTLRRILTALQTPGPLHSPHGGAEAEIAKIVADLLDSRVKKEAELEFLHRGKELADRMAKSMVDAKKKEVWSKYVEERVGPKLRELQAQIVTTFAMFIEGEFIVSCDKCRTEQSIKLTSTGVEQLIRLGYTSFRCSNEACRDTFGRHNISVSLQNLIKARLQLADEPPA